MEQKEKKIDSKKAFQRRERKKGRTSLKDITNETDRSKEFEFPTNCSSRQTSRIKVSPKTIITKKGQRDDANDGESSLERNNKIIQKEIVSTTNNPK